MINPVVHAKLSVCHARIEELDAVLTASGLRVAEIPRAAIFLAGKAFRHNRAAGGSRTCFPSLTLIAPEPQRQTGRDRSAAERRGTCDQRGRATGHRTDGPAAWVCHRPV